VLRQKYRLRIERMHRCPCLFLGLLNVLDPSQSFRTEVNSRLIANNRRDLTLFPENYCYGKE
jgi:hypothetical protein